MLVSAPGMGIEMTILLSTPSPAWTEEVECADTVGT